MTERQVPDLMLHLLDQWKLRREADSQSGEQPPQLLPSEMQADVLRLHEMVVTEFVQFCRAYMRKNQPTRLDYLTAGVGFQYQDGSILPYVTGGEQEAMVGNDPGVTAPITKTMEQHKLGQHGMEPTQSWEIT